MPRFLLRWGHGSWREQLSASVDGRLDEREQAALERHLAACARCRQELAQLRETVALLRLVPQVPSPRSFALGPEDVAALASPPTGLTILGAELQGAGRFQMGLRWATAAAALLLVAVVTYDVGTSVSGLAGRVASVQLAAPAPVPASAPTATQELRQRAPAPDQPAATPPPLGAMPAPQSDTVPAGQAPATLAEGGQLPSEAGKSPAPPQSPAGASSRPVPLAPLRLLEVALGAMVVFGVGVLWWRRRVA